MCKTFSLTAWMKSSCPAMSEVTTANCFQLYLNNSKCYTIQLHNAIFFTLALPKAWLPPDAPYLVPAVPWVLSETKDMVQIHFNASYSKITLLSRPELSAFQEMTGIPRYSASWRKYWDAAVVRPKCSLRFRIIFFASWLNSYCYSSAKY